MRDLRGHGRARGRRDGRRHIDEIRDNLRVSAGRSLHASRPPLLCDARRRTPLGMRGCDRRGERTRRVQPRGVSRLPTQGRPRIVVASRSEVAHADHRKGGQSDDCSHCQEASEVAAATGPARKNAYRSARAMVEPRSEIREPVQRISESRVPQNDYDVSGYDREEKPAGGHRATPRSFLL
jgi:hypothetical protein